MTCNCSQRCPLKLLQPHVWRYRVAHENKYKTDVARCARQRAVSQHMCLDAWFVKCGTCACEQVIDARSTRPLLSSVTLGSMSFAHHSTAHKHDVFRCSQPRSRERKCTRNVANLLVRILNVLACAFRDKRGQLHLVVSAFPHRPAIDHDHPAPHDIGIKVVPLSNGPLGASSLPVNALPATVWVLVEFQRTHVLLSMPATVESVELWRYTPDAPWCCAARDRYGMDLNELQAPGICVSRVPEHTSRGRCFLPVAHLVVRFASPLYVFRVDARYFCRDL